METTTEFQTATEQRDRFADTAGDRVTGVAALRSAQHYLHDAAHRETGAVSWVLHVLARQIGRAARRREDRLRAEFFPGAEVLSVEIPAQVQVLAPPYGQAWVSAGVVDGVDAIETVYEAQPTAEIRESLYRAVESAGAVTDHELDLLAARKIAVHAPTAIPQVVRWLAAAERTGRQEAEEEAEREQVLRTRAALMTCPDCGEPGRYVRESDIPSEEYDVRTAAEWLQTNEALTVCDACGRRWSVMV